MRWRYFIWFIGYSGSLLLHAGFLELRCLGFSLWWLLLWRMGDLGLTGFSSDDTQTYLPCGVWDWTKDRTCVPYIGRQILNLSTTREVWAEGLTLKKKKKSCLPQIVLTVNSRKGQEEMETDGAWVNALFPLSPIFEVSVFITVLFAQ